MKLPGRVRGIQRWTEDVIARLGTAPDTTIAVEIGITRQAVRLFRERRRIPAWSELKEISEELIARLGTASDVALAEEFGVSSDRIARKRVELGIARHAVPITHGKRSGYSRDCRCFACRRANAKGMSDWMAKNPKAFKKIRRRRRSKVLASAPHSIGKAAWYNLGCRCAGCVKAKSDYQKSYREACK